jgi:L-alanine-DL-glutamate epimerase-like enolase superfamily enzyme
MSDPVVSVEAIELSIPFSDGGSGLGLTPGRWTDLDMVLVRVQTRSGRVGWGEAFSYVCRRAVAAAVRDMVAPLAIGREPDDVVAITDEAQRRLHLFGRYGITMFAISGLDIALWDLKAQAAGVPLHGMFGASHRQRVQAYASLVRYGDPVLVEDRARRAADEGYTSIKLHEVETGTIQAGRRGAGTAAHLTVDVNCAWSAEQVRRMIPGLQAIGADWLEEPVFPPEDHTTLASLRGAGIRIAAGENACTAMAFRQMLDAGAVDIAQPSVTKVGGVTEFLRVSELCAERDVPVMPHSPYFGPGYWATLHLTAALPGAPLFEVLHIDLEAEFGEDRPKPVGGQIAVPQGPGLGFRPDAATLARYRV